MDDQNEALYKYPSGTWSLLAYAPWPSSSRRGRLASSCGRLAQLGLTHAAVTSRSCKGETAATFAATDETRETKQHLKGARAISGVDTEV